MCVKNQKHKKLLINNWMGCVMVYLLKGEDCLSGGECLCGTKGKPNVIRPVLRLSCKSLWILKVASG